MASLDSLLREAECLQRGRKNDTFSSIGLRQISHFFSAIAPEDQSSIEGRLLLAQQGIDCAKMEEIIKTIGNKSNNKEANQYSTKSKNPDFRHRPLSAIEQFQRIRQKEMERKWREATETIISEISNTYSTKCEDTFEKLFPVDAKNMLDLSERAITFIECLTQPDIGELPFSSTSQILSQSIKAIEQMKKPGDETYKMRFDFFSALSNILNKESLKDKTTLKELMTDSDILHEMVRGSLDFLYTQFREINFECNGPITKEDIDRYVAKAFPDVQAPWPQIWVAIRAGLINLVFDICNEHPAQTRLFTPLFESYVIKKEEPTPEIRVSVIADYMPTLISEKFKLHVYSYTVGCELPQAQNAVLLTVEDYIFSVLSPLRFNNSHIGSNDDYGSLNDVQTIVLEEASKLFSEGNLRFVYPMLLALCLQFDACVDNLLTAKVFPIEVVHILLAFKSCGLWDNPILPSIVEEFVNLLPLSYTHQSIIYLAFAGDSNKLIKYLMNLDIGSHQIDLTGLEYEQAITLINEHVFQSDVEALHLDVLCMKYDDAANRIIGISEQISYYTIFDQCKAISLCCVLLSRIQGYNHIINNMSLLMKATLEIAITVLSNGDKLSQSARKSLIDNVHELLDLITEDSDTQDLIIKARNLNHCCTILTLFDSGKPQNASTLIKGQPRVFPLNENEVDTSCEWIYQNRLESSTLIATVTVRAISYFALTPNKFMLEITALLKFSLCLQLPDEITDKILRIQDNLGRLL